jgi:disulfide bond formation protein DsbB
VECLLILLFGRKNRGMNTEAFQVFTSLLSVVVLAAAVVITLAQVLESKVAWASDLVAQVRSVGLWLISAVTIGSMAGSLHFSENIGFVPCKYCWYQRIAMFSLALVSLIAAVRRDIKIAIYTLALALVGLSVSAWHYLIEWFPNLKTTSCSLDVPCTAVWFREFGFVTLASMAGSAFLFVITVSVALMRQPSQLTNDTADVSNTLEG